MGCFKLMPKGVFAVKLNSITFNPMRLVIVAMPFSLNGDVNSNVHSPLPGLGEIESWLLAANSSSTPPSQGHNTFTGNNAVSEPQEFLAM